MERVDNYTVEEDAYDGGNIATQRDNDRNQSSLSTSSSPFSRNRRSSSTTIASPHASGRASGSLQPPPKSRRRTSDQRQHGLALSSPEQYLQAPQSHTRKSASHVTAVAASMECQLKSPRSNRSSHSRSLSHTVATSATATASSLNFSSFRPKTNGRHRSFSNSALASQDSTGDDSSGDWHESSANEREDGKGPRDAASDREINYEEW
ncbi:hypothetical protein MMC13_000442 [Lambiella insularis]|nr:hypothetical protein [Lambiella insularis]